jgi:hypothetical protein
LKNQSIIVDLDGTLTNFRHRYHLLDDELNHESEFFAKCIDDKIYDWCRTIVNALYPTHNIFIVTGRPDIVRTQTKRWLQRHGVNYDDLFMRSTGDYSDDGEAKKSIYKKDLKDKNVRFVIDDRAHVVDMWRSLGLVCLQCAEGRY